MTFAWLPLALALAASSIAVLGAVITSQELRDYVREHYAEMYRKATWTEEFGEDSYVGPSLMAWPAVRDPELMRLRERVTKWMIAGAFALAADMAGAVIFLFYGTSGS
jgi:hypothetical protein